MNRKCICIPVEYPTDAELSVVYMMPCKICGNHTMIRKKGDYSVPKKVEVFKKGGLKLIFDYSILDLDFFKIHSSLLTIPNILPDFKVGTGLGTDRSREILYEMLADGDITEDQFNNHIFKI